MVQDRVVQMIRSTFNVPELEITENTVADDVDRWDSLSHIQLIMKIEKEFKIRFALGELQGLKNVGDLIRTIEKKTVKASS